MKIFSTQRSRRVFLILFYSVGFFAFLLYLGYLWLSSEIPPLESLKNYQPKLITRVYDRNGRLMVDLGDEDRELVRIEELPPYVIYAFVAAEDASFFQHRGLDYAGILRAFWKNLIHARVVQGGSTITQQVAKTFFLSPERKLIRKLREILLALKLERHLTKEEILYLYLNQIYFGRGAYGIKAAARNYFQKGPSSLTLAEAALLAGLPRSPNRSAPHRDPASARSRQLYVLDQMLSHGWISPEEYAKALSENIAITPNPSPFWQAPYAAELVRQWLIAQWGNDTVHRGGLLVYTTFDLDLIRYAQRAVEMGVAQIDARGGFRGPIGYLEPEEWESWLQREGEEFFERLISTGKIQAVAWVGPRSYRVTLGDLSDPVTALVTPDLRFSGIVTGFSTKEDFAWLLTPAGLARLPAFTLKKFSGYESSWTGKLSKLFKPGDLISVRPLSPERIRDPENPKRSLISLWDPRTPGALIVDLDQEPEIEGALLCIIPDTGEILAVVGGRDFRRSQFNRAMQAVRQPGSAFKPVVYAAALEHGFTPVTRVSDNPLVYQDLERQTQWKPKNFEERFFGDLLLYQALALSRNVVTLQIATRIGIDAILEMAKRLGIEGDLPRNFTIALGSQGVTLRELVRVYSVFHNLGAKPDLFFVREVWDLRGKRIYASTPPPSESEKIFPYRALAISPPPATSENFFHLPSYDASAPQAITSYPQVLSSSLAYSMTFLLRQVVERGTGWRVRALNRPVAGKTGTTDNYNDAWFIGYIPGVLTGVWVGRDDAKPMGKGEVGGKAAAPIWLAFMSEVIKDKPVQDFPIPEGVVFEKVDPLQGKRAGILTERVIWVPFPEGITPSEFSEVSSLPPLSIDPFSTPGTSTSFPPEEEF